MPLQTATSPEFTAPLTKVALSTSTAAAVNADRIAEAVKNGIASAAYTHPMLQLTWQNAAAFTATLVSLCVLCDWFWKRFWRPLFERRGWIKPRKRRVLTPSEWAELAEKADQE